MNSDKSIVILFNKIDKEFSKIKDEYKECLKEMNIKDSLYVGIYDFLNHNKSILDYLSQEIKNFCSPKPRRTYFPIAPKAIDKPTFEKNLNKWFPGLKNSKKDIYNYLVYIQHFNDNNWLPEFSELCNNFKHVEIVPYGVSDYASITVSFKGRGFRVGERVLKKLIIDKGGALVIRSRDGEKRCIRGPQIINVNTTQIDNADPGITIQREKWRDFKFSVSDHSALGLLGIIKQNVNRIYKKLKNMIENP